MKDLWYALVLTILLLRYTRPDDKVISKGFSPEAVAQGCSVKKVFLEILQNSQENTCARVSFSIKLQT